MGCDLGQGFLFARPMEAGASLAFLAAQPPARRSMHHSYEALDRAGGTPQARPARAPATPRLSPTALGSGMCISLLGDGAFMVALAWQVYALSDATDRDGHGRYRHDRTHDRPSCSSEAWFSDRFRSPPSSCSAPTSRVFSPPSAPSPRYSLTSTLEIWHVAHRRRRVRHGTGVLRPSLRRHRPRSACRGRTRAGKRPRPDRQADRAAHGRTRRSAACSSAPSAPEPRSRSTPPPSPCPPPRCS